MTSAATSVVKRPTELQRSPYLQAVHILSQRTLPSTTKVNILEKSQKLYLSVNNVLGPVSFYMSKAANGAANYDGSGDWFKIKDIGPTFSGGSATWDLEKSYSVTIPKSVPSGDYLLRIQQLAIHNPYPAGIPQFYVRLLLLITSSSLLICLQISCAQVTVTGGGNGIPSPTAKIPGFIHDTDPGYTVNIYNNFNNYTVP